MARIEQELIAQPQDFPSLVCEKLAIVEKMCPIDPKKRIGIPFDAKA